MPEREEQWSDRAWNWVVKITGLGVFIYATTIRDEAPSFSVAFLAIALAIFPIKDVRMMLRRWQRDKGGP